MRILTLLCLLFTLALPAAAQEANGTITTENTDQLDANIANRIRDILSELGNYGDVSVTVSEGIVTFRGTATSAIEATELGPLANRVEGVVAVKNEVTETTDIAERLNPAVERFRARIDQFLVFLPLAAIAGVVFFIIVLIGMRIARARQPWERLAPNAFIADLFRHIVRIIFVIAAIVIALDILNATALLSTILGAAGIIGLALGFAVRDTVENFIASVMLSIRQPFRPNDTVEINGDQGKVIRLTSRATILLSFDGNHIRIPNATVFKSRIINFSQNAERRFMFSILIDRGQDLQVARTLIQQTVQDLPFVIDVPAAQAWIEGVDTSSVEIVVTGWIDQNASSIVLSKGEAIRQVKLALREAEIELTNSAQVVILEGQGDDATSQPARQQVATSPTETTAVETVSAKSDEALDEIIKAEREADANEDLLREEAMKE
ncbi:mechanosensitive ion channel domain-containing protein [Yoonia sp. 208BN28-4]|uniref:mechanosensitive ion channel domain-containing protein n=1 Tax=Yoonia sp. 208BN28-4 TaxID=3126505 RepID=UPI0030A48F9B